ncbi:hypothetical protein [Streptomyces sp. 7N604]|uniref:hypothetical protein n=1 Tax=Streptomyces sp. 7N604 TaxID=3457415 RepID=UPI003FD06DB6
MVTSDTADSFTPLAPDHSGDIVTRLTPGGRGALQPATTELPARTDPDVLRAVARELAVGILNQFWLSPTRLP